ncbi:MAG: hypothetical protein CK604_05905 [Curvibacter sp. PD_MW3]|nr:MAG: hypothetical protein CK604_05905 [Curvibacter sp. PD_MW3]
MIAAELVIHATKHGASIFESEKLGDIARRAFPILLWKINAGELAFDPETAIEMSLLIPFGISVSALQRVDIPMELRQPFLPLLRPDAHEVTLVWWDKQAVPKWVAPYLRSMAQRGDFEPAFELTSCWGN